MFDVIVGGLLERQGKVLLVKAKVGVPKGLWNLPAGHLKENEGVFKAVEREVQEETGYRAKVIGLVGVYHRIGGGRNVIRLNYKCDIVGGKEISSSREIECVKWFSLRDVKRMPAKDFAWGTRETIYDYFERGVVNARETSFKPYPAEALR